MSDFVHGEQTETHREADIEKAELGEEPPIVTDSESTIEGQNAIAEAARAKELQHKVGILGTMRGWENALDRKMGIETQGIDRIKDEDKKPPSIINVFFLWWSLTCHVGTIPIGILGPEFGLSLNQSIAAIVVGTMLGALCTAYTGTLGPKVSLQS